MSGRWRVDFTYAMARQPDEIREHHVTVGNVCGPGEALLLARGHLEAQPDLTSIDNLRASYVGSETPPC